MISHKDSKKMTVIVKPTHDCNFRCRYCYIPQENVERGHMNDETLEVMTEQLISNFDEVYFIWHGGEPTLMGLEFYQKVKDKQTRYDAKRFGNGIQTNASLLTEELLDFFKKENFNIGLSIDGPKHLHDITRVYPSGEGTFDDVMKSVNLMKEKKMRTGAICVLNRYNIDEIDEIYDFFNRNEIGLKANPLIQSGRAKNNTDLSITPQEYAKAMIRLFDRGFLDENLKIEVDSIRDDIKSILTGEPYGCSSVGNCAERFLGIDPSGDVYPCGSWSFEKEFRYGNINEVPLSEILKSEKRQELIKRKETMNNAECKPCNWKEICNGGCMRSAYEINKNVYSRDVWCESRKIIFDYVSQKVDSQLMLATVGGE